ncbi:hypothetical protein PAXRUDRAFT_828299 [Paxillus rubicundulus Ve08.2h10]|uniref:Uncharacterized protein n=1 Tax=Paxillus rubicundulus Ve08.2h10 TaxID=930991 RepID=A0A0D0DAG5_9AGAM|nr:hypothetical protein PAXRUDRAFT_828299 [Paxillus rubicundulus Ve08.2h10]
MLSNIQATRWLQDAAAFWASLDVSLWREICSDLQVERKRQKPRKALNLGPMRVPSTVSSSDQVTSMDGK